MQRAMKGWITNRYHEVVDENLSLKKELKNFGILYLTKVVGCRARVVVVVHPDYPKANSHQITREAMSPRRTLAGTRPVARKAPQEAPRKFRTILWRSRYLRALLKLGRILHCKSPRISIPRFQLIR